MFLKQLLQHGLKCKILYYKTPKDVYKVDYKGLIDDLYNTVITDNKEDNKQYLKKILNITVGMLEKTYNTNQRSTTFTTLEEACYHQSIHGGKIYSIAEYQNELVEVDEDEFRSTEIEGTKYYVFSVSEKRTLINGFVYIKELLLQYHNFKMYNAYNLLTENNVKVYSIKTDAMTINKKDIDKVYGYTFTRKWIDGLLKFDDEIGDWRLEVKKSIVLPTNLYEYKDNELPKIPNYDNINISIEDEWDTQTICNKITEQNPVMIRGLYPGTGKSYIGEGFSKMDKNVLFVVPNNRQLQERLNDGVSATTYNKFFSIAVNEDAGEKMPVFDYSDYDVIVFDEIYMSNIYTLNKVWQFVNNNPDLIIIGTGDVNQLGGIGDICNCQDKAEYTNNCINIIFKYDIFLEVCKRLGPEDCEVANKNREILKNIYEDIIINNLPRWDVIPKNLN